MVQVTEVGLAVAVAQCDEQAIGPRQRRRKEPDALRIGLANREGGGLKYGRIFKPADELHGFSVDVVDMDSIAGPHHTHPLGEIDLIMPMDATATFDGHGAGWLVYGPGSAHRPTVTQGRALVLYLLPGGAIEFTRA